jgi:hypothetical protein
MIRQVIAGVLIAMIAFYAGFTFGGYVTIKAVASMARGFLDEDMVSAAIFQYKNHISQCYPSIENAFNNWTERD